MIIIVGTSHSYQMATTDTAIGKEMLNYLYGLCAQHKIEAVGEEMSREALDEYKSKESIPMNLAKKFNLQHCFCDPSRAERVNLSIQQDNDIKAKGFRNNLSEKEISIQIELEYAKREEYWLKQLQIFNQSPLLFVCGANHTKSFAKLLVNNDFKVDIASKDWEPTSSNEIN